ncbi:MAG: YIP1 family protein [Caldilineales bacterium]
MQTIKRPFALLWDALFLQRPAYAHMRDDDNPFVEGLFVLAVLGIVLGVAGLIGGSLEWASSPNINAIRDTVFANLQKMTWWPMVEQNPDIHSGWLRLWDGIWRVVATMTPTPANSLLGLVTRPLGLILGWLVYGVLALLFARLLGGRGTLNQTLGATALAAAPQMLTLLTVLPFVTLAGLGVWSLLCNYMALRTVHGLSWQRTLWAALLPGAVLLLLAVLLGFVAASVAGPLFSSWVGGVS